MSEGIARTYRVTWTIEVEADYARAAARRALEIQRNPESIATVFEVEDIETGKTHTVDLDP